MSVGALNGFPCLCGCFMFVQVNIFFGHVCPPHSTYTASRPVPTGPVHAQMTENLFSNWFRCKSLRVRRGRCGNLCFHRHQHWVPTAVYFFRGDLGQHRPENFTSRSWIRRGAISCSPHTSFDEIDDSVVNSERGELVRGSDPPFGVERSLQRR